MKLQTILWDFGDTLADERWMLAPLPGAAGWPAAYRQIIDGDDLADRWNLGLATMAEVAEALALRLGVNPRRVIDHMRACSRDLVFFPRVMDLVKVIELPQAIVTVNCDVFSDVVVPAYSLNERFETIVTSWEEATLSKADLCDIAMARLPGATDRGACLLIDNKLANVLEWRARGGAAFCFEGADALVAAVNLFWTA